MSKRILKLIFVIYMVTLMVSMPALPAATESGNIIRNGDFENASTMKNDWDIEHGQFYEYADGTGEIVSRQEMTNALPGGKTGYAAKIENQVKNFNVWFRQWLYVDPPGGVIAGKIVPGATYRLSYSFYADDLGDRNDNGVGIFLEFFETNYTNNNNDGFIGNASFRYMDSSTNGRWTTVTGTFTFPSNGKMIRMLLRSFAVGTVYFDDISLEMVEAEKFEYQTSHMFHYTGEKEGTVSVSLLPYYQGTGLTAMLSASFAIYDGETYLTGSKNVRFVNEKASFTYSVDVLKVKQKKYTLSVTVRDSSGVIDTFSQSLYRYDRPNFLDEDGNFCNENGKIINPFIAWNIRSEHYAEAKRAGFTMYTIGYDDARIENIDSREKNMAKAKKADMYGLFCLFIDMKAAAHPDNIENTKKIVEMYKDDRSFVGWVAQDEPLGGGITEEIKEQLELSYTTIRNIDPNHPVILLDYNKVVFKETSKYCDIFMPNSYGTGYANVRDYVEEAVTYSNGHPVWPNVKAYANGNGTVELLPTGQQLQHFICQAFTGGARGVSVYEFEYAVRKPSVKRLSETPLWSPLVDTGKIEVPVLFDLFVHDKCALSQKETASYVERKWARADGDYYFLLSQSNADTTITYPAGVGKAVRLLVGDSTNYFTLSKDILSVTLKSGDVLMFKVFDTSMEARITKSDGIGIKCAQLGSLTFYPSANAENLVIAVYKEVNGKQQLQQIKWHFNSSAGVTEDLFKNDENYRHTIKVFSWDDTFNPAGKPAVLLPTPNPFY